MSELKWKYYNHALLPTTAPHEKVDEMVIKLGKIWKNKWGGGTIINKMDNRF